MGVEEVYKNRYKDKIVTIPNILSFIRICLIPIIVWLYVGEKNYPLTGIMVILSSMTDIIDGIIARKFNMTSDLGKVLDPIADKATQGVVAILLAIRFPMMILLVCLGIIKELFMAISGFLVIKKQGIVLGANWHGKLNTVVIVSTMALHIVWYDITPIVSTITITMCLALTTLSLTLYAIRNFKYIFKKV